MEELGAGWSTTLLGLHGEELYRLELRPYWKVEGGFTAVEIALSRPGNWEENFLCKRLPIRAQRCVITVEDLAAGIEKSKHGKTRVFRLPSPHRESLLVEILASELYTVHIERESWPAIRSIALDLSVGMRRR